MPQSNKIGNYPSTLITVSLTVALFLIGFAGLLALNSKKLVSLLRQHLEVQVYFEKDTPQLLVDSVRAVIAEKPYLIRYNDVPQITFISKEEAAKRFTADTGENHKTVLTDNPFRNALVLQIQENYINESQLQQIKADLEPLKGVFLVDYAQNFADNINENISKLYLILSVSTILLVIAIFILVNNTIRLALYAQRFLVRSMQLVGATDGFIQKPFLKQSLFQGFLAGLLATGLLALLQQIAIQKIDGLASLQEYDKLGILIALLFVLGILITFLCTWQAMRRYLHANLDELY